MAFPTAPRSAATANLKGWIPHVVDSPRLFDTTTVAAHELQAQLSAGKIKSTEILHEYYRHILKHNGYLNGVYELAPGALQRAQELDTKRAQGEYLGPLHGIPVLIKVSLLFHMESTLRCLSGQHLYSPESGYGHHCWRCGYGWQQAQT
jgi:Amidase